MTSCKTRKIAIVGAGIGGLCLAIVLKKQGHNVVVFERNSKISAQGAGLLLSIKSLRLLQQHVLDNIIEAGTLIRSSFLLGSKKKILLKRLYHPFVHHNKYVAFAIHRERLHNLLLEAYGDVNFSQECIGYRYDSDKIVLKSKDKKEISADLVVGADGINSNIRRQMLGGDAIRYSGYFCFRGISPIQNESLQNIAFESWGEGKRIGGADIGKGEFYWYATQNQSDAKAPKDCLNKDYLLQNFSQFDDDILQIISSYKGKIIATPIVDRVPPYRLIDKKVCLLGDAAHAMTPNLGQGASQAIYDGIILNNALNECDDVQSALKKYQDMRLEKVKWLNVLSWYVGKCAQWDNKPLTLLRNFIIKIAPF